MRSFTKTTTTITAWAVAILLANAHTSAAMITCASVLVTTLAECTNFCAGSSNWASASINGLTSNNCTSCANGMECSDSTVGTVPEVPGIPAVPDFPDAPEMPGVPVPAPTPINPDVPTAVSGGFPAVPATPTDILDIGASTQYVCPSGSFCTLSANRGVCSPFFQGLPSGTLLNTNNSPVLINGGAKLVEFACIGISNYDLASGAATSGSCVMTCPDSCTITANVRSPCAGGDSGDGEFTSPAALRALSGLIAAIAAVSAAFQYIIWFDTCIFHCVARLEWFMIFLTLLNNHQVNWGNRNKSNTKLLRKAIHLHSSFIAPVGWFF